MTKVKEKILLGSILVALILFLVSISFYSASRYVGDTALFAQITSNIAHTGKAEGNIFANTQDYIDRHISAIPVDERIADDEAFQPPESQSRNILKFHCYIILYLLAPLCYFMSGFSCITIAQSTALAFSIFFIILLLHEKKIPIPVIIATIFLLISHPGWSIPAVYGPFYPERLFMGTGMYLVWSCEREKFSKPHFIIATILCALVGERGALYAGMFILAHTIFFWNRNKQNILKLTMGFISLGYSAFLMKFVLSNLFYSNLTQRFNIFPYLAIPDNRKKIILFLVINIFLFLIIAVFDLRAFLIGAASLIPNLLYDCGGSEKIGWKLHYHVLYFVILMWAVTRGIICLYGWLNKKEIKYNLQKIVPVGVSIGFSFMLGFINPYDISISFSVDNIKNNIVFSSSHEIYNKYILGGMKTRKDFNNFISKNISKAAIVSTIEPGMCALSDDHQIYLFPMGTHLADAVIVHYIEEDDKIQYIGSVTYYSVEETRKLDQFVVNKMEKEGYDIDNPNLFPSYGIAVINKK